MKTLLKYRTLVPITACLRMLAGLCSLATLHAAPDLSALLQIDSSLEMRIVFMPNGTYELRNLQGYIVVGEWETTEDGLAEVPVSWRDYEGVWYFEPLSKDELHLEVPELDTDRIFYRTQ